VSPQTLAHGLHSHKRGWRSLEQAHHTQSTCFLSLRLGTQSFTFEYLPCGRFWDRCLHILKISPNIIACKRLSA
jgi:hypothetical protein